jgi:two-component system CheB/CheR fusion protein
MIEGAPDRLQQVVWNLVMNAVKFTPSGVAWTSRPSAAAHRRPRRHGHGSGHRPDLLPHVFEPFLQGDSSTRRSTSGLGLGLALVRRMVELHAGR